MYLINFQQSHSLTCTILALTSNQSPPTHTLGTDGGGKLVDELEVIRLKMDLEFAMENWVRIGIKITTCTEVFSAGVVPVACG